jgi:plastocyanin
VEEEIPQKKGVDPQSQKAIEEPSIEPTVNLDQQLAKKPEPTQKPLLPVQELHVVKEPAPFDVDIEPVVTQEIDKKTHSIQGIINFSNETDAKIESTIVYFIPDNGQYPEIKAKTFEISTQNKRFEPSVLAIPVGSEVRFPNMDRILHNVFSVSPESSFDLGLYSAGTAKTVKFDKPGIIYVHCNVHHSMQADILVLETPWYTSVKEDGSFEIENLPDLAGTLYSWHPRANLGSQKIDSLSTNKLLVELEITRQLVPKHLNKFGKSYRPEKE